MPITYRAHKGAPLTADEIDDNFRELDQRLKQIEDHPEAGEGLGQINLEGDQITFIGNFGTDFGTFTLPKIAPPSSPPSLPLYEKETLPRTEDPGTIALLMDPTGPHFIFFDGQTWKLLMKGDLP